MKPTHARRTVLGLLILHYAHSYMDRVAIAGVAPLIRDEFGLGEVGLGAVFTAFAIGYGLFQVPWGWLADRMGARRILTLVVSFWSVFTTLTAAAWSATSLLVIRFLFGAGEAGGFPAATRAMSRWFPAAERGMAQGITHAGSRVGAAIALPLVVAISAATNWRIAFVAFGAMGFIWAGVWYAYYRDRPEDHPAVNEAELEILGDSPAWSEDGGPISVPWRAALSSSNMWLLCLMYAATVYTGWIYFSWFPTYLMETRGFSLLESGFYGSLPLWCGAIGNTIGGWATDRRVKSHGLRIGRRSVAIGGFGATVVCILIGAASTEPWIALAFLSLASGALQITVSVSWAVAIDVGGQFSGTVSAIMNSCGNLGGAISPLAFGVLAARTGSWQVPFFVAAGMCTLAGLCWLRIDPERPVVTPSAPSGFATTARE